MTKNDVLRRIRYTFDFNDDKMIAIFALAGHKVTRTEISDWMKREEDPAYKTLYDDELAMFLNGLIVEKRGRKDGPIPKPEHKLTNNVILKKLQIALNLRAEEVLDVLMLVDLKVSKYELSAFFRKPDHKHYRPLRDQILRNFLNGMQLKYRQTDQDMGQAPQK
ncbi:MAG: DUF1456 family protein [Candidatus Marinimicrobia bacterium]|jgi:uncharacterized protein YehS (DUF1456 family)|nr:DUF1456 family protein [Candidatus Neomarinimicrobiota bacterium]MBT3630149.1 DUF1456 family protein [Candidatus Neomarinimicrobiota bacterium]MBT3826101.1 DUF1456 family protein [Candidatus Neomarinimicrobiota bacterium]MBT4132135.1 DUF1456 family protein [Candidatus Neomarinimicrobiota bacterium]MBT4296622.1 DUF1456 family protein [Candidatus Neomarinimicrobiota bacterium]